jgi:Tetratricopeptide repeat
VRFVHVLTGMAWVGGPLLLSLLVLPVLRKRLHQQALDARRRQLGDDHPDTLWSLDSLPVTRRDLGDLQGARQLFEQTLAARRRVLGGDHPDTLNLMNNLAELQRKLGEATSRRLLAPWQCRLSLRATAARHGLIC